MDALLKALTAYLKDQEETMRDVLKRMVLIQSGTRNKAGVDRVCREIYDLLEPLSLDRRILPQETYGDMLIASVPSGDDGRRILLAGHMDTIFPADTAFCGWREDETHFYGPGVIDMKGGLVVGLFALKALATLGLLENLPITWIFNSEEEVGSPVSRSLFVTEAKRSAMAFVLEAGGMKGQIVTGRKGRLELKLSARGRAGHAAQVVEGKKSAILDLAHVIIELEGLNGRFPGVSVNIGQTGGGIVPNSVPEDAWAAVDVRSPSREGFAFFHSCLDELLMRRQGEGMELKIEVVEQVPILEATEQNKALFNVIAGEANRLAIPVVEQFRAGASDANTIAEVGTPVMDGLGPVGRHDHSDREYLVRESLCTRSALLALSLLAAWRRYGEGTLF
ncbi:MAG: M20/M25/M40 family metallo-hydrolase [Syntrophales bacterium]|nr:M20/M25/M40 family metallo-hydrolase [Syntrophales bacterium]